MKCFCSGPYLYTQLFGEGKREEKFRGLVEFDRSKQMTIAKSKSGSRVKHMSWIRGNLEKKRIQVAYFGLMHIWVLAFGNKYNFRVCYNP